MSLSIPRFLSAVLLLALLAVSPSFGAGPTPATDRERLGFNDGWRFRLGDSPDAGDRLEYAKLRDWLRPVAADFLYFESPAPVRPAGEPDAAVEYSKVGYDDAAWRPLRLPHDWGIEGPFSQDLPGETGKLPWAGVGWYRKTFDLPASDAGRRLFLDIDGAMSFSTVWLNGRLVGGWPYGYSSFRLDLTPYAVVGGRNVLAVRLENRPESSRWYPGSGLYRNVWLTKTAPVHVAHWGVAVTTPRVSAESADVDVRVRLYNSEEARVETKVSVELHVADAFGRLPAGSTPVARVEPRRFAVGPRLHQMESFPLVVTTPRLWGPGKPALYVAVTRVSRGDVEIDRVETTFGIRSLAVDAARGLLVNGEVVELNGVCQHHDLGALGAAINVRAMERQLEILRDMGVNAIRTSHNPPAPELLELCDRMGLLVMNETFDAWARGKKRDDYSRFFADWHEADTRALVRRDRNHPSVIMWSIGNEVREQETPEGWKISARLAGIVREEDRTRPTTAGFNHVWSGYVGFESTLDVFGYNYKPGEYAAFAKRHPHIPLIGSETASTVSTRGYYLFPVTDNRDGGRADLQVSSYDLYTPGWATIPETEWSRLDSNPRVLGEFVWTGFDYLGEPTPYNNDSTNILNYQDPAERARAEKELAALGKIRVPSRSSYFGIVDLAGFPKDRYYLYQSRWRPDLPMAHILPHWSWPERVGQVTPVHVYTSGDEAELFLNGRSLGSKRLEKGKYRFRWDDVVYEPGELKVLTRKNGKPWAEAVQRTAGPAASLTLSADRARLRADGDDLVFVTVRVVDAAGVLVPRAANAITFAVEGAGDFIAADNGDPTSLVSFSSPVREAFHGLALAIIRSRPSERGPITITATTPGLLPTKVVIVSE